MDFVAQQMLPGHLVGIQIGTDATAATPTDFELHERLGHGQRAAAAPATLIDSIIAGDTTGLTSTTTNNILGMVYMPVRDCYLEQLDAMVYRSGAAPGNVVMRVYAIQNLIATTWTNPATILAVSNVVNANAWLVSPGQFETFTFATPKKLYHGQIYLFVIYPSQAAAANYVGWRYGTLALSNYVQRVYMLAGTPGASLANTSGFPLFRLYGNADVEFEYGATDLFGKTVANPNASFTLSRRFWNNSGTDNIDIQECGIYAPVTRYWLNPSSDPRFSTFVTCVARDVIAPAVTVDDGESLEVTYTPAITV